MNVTPSFSFTNKFNSSFAKATAGIKNEFYALSNISKTEKEWHSHYFTPIYNNQKALQNENYQVFTAFEIFEHLLNPYTVLENVKCDKVLISIPMRLWFSAAYRSKTDKWDRHYHEFEDWQLDWLLEKTGFKIVDSIKFTHPVKKFGFRPLLRYFTNRYYLVYAEKVK